MGIRCKMKLENVFAQAWGGAKAIFRCEYDQKIAEDLSFQKATPSGLASSRPPPPNCQKRITSFSQLFGSCRGQRSNFVTKWRTGPGDGAQR
jgi:hypothetical protein